MTTKQSRLVTKIEAKGFKAVDVSRYEDQNSLIKVACEKGHEIETSWRYIRSEHFKCPICHGGVYKFHGAKTPPLKKDNVYRVIALDNATEKMGLSVFDNGELVLHTLLEFEGLLEDRLLSIYNVLTQVVISQWKPDYMVFEDIQFQQNHKTYKILAMLFGIITLALKQKNIPHTNIQVKVWREHYQISSGRKIAKHEAIKKVKQMYKVDVSDDVAEAILIGRYAVDKLAEKLVKKGF